MPVDIPDPFRPLISAFFQHATREIRFDRPLRVQTGGATANGNVVYTTAETTPVDPGLLQRDLPHPRIAPHRQHRTFTGQPVRTRNRNPELLGVSTLRTVLAPAVDYGLPILGVGAPAVIDGHQVLAISLGDSDIRQSSTFLVPHLTIRRGFLDLDLVTRGRPAQVDYLPSAQAVNGLIRVRFDRMNLDWEQFTKRLYRNSRHEVTFLRSPIHDRAN